MAAREIQRAFVSLCDALGHHPQGGGEPDTAANLIKRFCSYFEDDLTQSESDFIIATCFPRDDGERGILELLKSAKQCKDIKLFKQFKEGACRFIGLAVTRMPSFYLETLGPQIKEVAWQLAEGSDEDSRVRVRALRLLVALVSRCAGTSAAGRLGAAQLLDRLLQRHLVRPALPSVRQQQLHLAGALCQHYPTAAAQQAERVRGLLLSELHRQVDSASAKVEKAVVAGALQGLRCFLHSFSQSPGDDAAVCRQIYEAVKRVVNPDVDLSRREAPREGLELLAAHAAQFGQHLLTDYKLMYTFMLKWATSKNSDDSRAGILALDALLDQLTHQLMGSPENAPASGDTLLQVFKFLQEQLQLTISQSFDLTRQQRQPAGLLELTVRAYGSLARPCRRLAPSAQLETLVRRLLQRAEQRYPPGALPLGEDLQQLSGYVWAAAVSVCQLETVPPEREAAAERLLLLLSEQYARVPPRHRFLADAALAQALQQVVARPELAQARIDTLVYQMLLRSCCHPVSLEAELERDAASSYAERSVGVVDFLPMWDALMTAQQQRFLTNKGATLETLHALSASLHHGLLTATQRLLAELDLTTVPPPDDGPVNYTPADPTAGVAAKTPKDFQVFLNLVQLLEHVLLTPALAERCRSWLPLLTRHLLEHSRRAPLVSGLYRLTGVCLRLCHRLQLLTSEDGEWRTLRTLLEKFVADTAVRCRQFQDELQAASVAMVLAAPPELVEGHVAPLLHTAQVALRLGRCHLPLATAALEALERWLPLLMPAGGAPPQHLESLRRMVPLLNLYLSPHGGATEETAGDARVGARSAASSNRSGRSHTRSEDPLAAVRARCLQLLSQLAAAGVAGDEGAPATACSRTPALKLAVPFSDLKPTLCLEPLLARVLELALSAGDGQTRTTACELLHAIVIYAIGKGAARGMTGEELRPVFSRLLPALVTLAADDSLVVRQLFAPLLEQTVHWLSNPQMAGRPEAEVLRHTLMDGLMDRENSARRSLCAQTLQEMLHWLLSKHGGEPVEKAAPLLEPLYGCLRHPDPHRRLGGTVAFNSMYRELREHVPLVRAHALPLTVRLLWALAHAQEDPPQLGTLAAAQAAVGHCCRILRKCAPLLCQESAAGGETSSLPQLLRWLLLQAAAPQAEFRRACLRLVADLTPHTPGAGSLQLQLSAAGGAAALFEGPLRAGAGAPPTGQLPALLAALDGYLWALSEAAVTADALAAPDSGLLQQVHSLLEAGHGTAALPTALQLLTAVLPVQPRLLTGLWTAAAADTVARAALVPAQLQHDSDAAAAEQLRRSAAALLAAAAAVPAAAAALTAAAARCVADWSVCDEVKLALTGGTGLSAWTVLKGLQTLHKSGFLQATHEAAPALPVGGDELWTVAWDAEVRRTPDGLQLRDRSPAQRQLADAALSLALDLGTTPGRVAEALLLEEPVGLLCDGQRGWLTLLRTASALVPALLRSPLLQREVAVLVARAPGHCRGLHLLTVLAQTTSADRQLSGTYGPQVSELVASGWQQLQQQQQPGPLLLLLGLLLQLHPSLAAQPVAAELVAWYSAYLQSAHLSLQEKEPALRLLGPMLSAPQLAESAGALVDNLTLRHFPLNSAELPDGSPQRAAYRAALRALCAAVERTALPALGGRVAALLCREEGHFCLPLLTEALASAASRHGVAAQAALAEALSALLEGEGRRSAGSRLVLLSSCLQPLLRACQRHALLRYFNTERVRRLLGTVQTPEPMTMGLASEAVEHAWATRTTAFGLLEVMYACLERSDVHDPNAPLLVAYAAPTAAKGNELTRALVSAGLEVFRAPSPGAAEAGQLAEARRRCCCAAYRALTAAVCATQTEAKFFNKVLFEEDPKKGRLVWSRLVSQQRKYSFPLDREWRPQRRPTSVPAATAQAEAGGGAAPARPPGTVTQFLADSSLCSQAAQYDFTNSVVLNSQQTEARQGGEHGGWPRPRGGSVALAPDDLNDHECMATLTALVRHMALTVELPAAQTPGGAVLGQPPEPRWVCSVRRGLEDPCTPDNAVLLLARLVVNCWEVCRPHAAALLPALTRCIAGRRLGEQLDALLLDTLELVAAWVHEDGLLPPDTEQGGADASGALQLALQVTPHRLPAVVTSGLHIFSRLARGWVGRAQFPTATACALLQSPEAELRAPLVGLSALGVALLSQQELSMTDQQQHSVLKSVLALMSRGTAEVYRRAGEVAALLVARLFQDGADGQQTRESVAATLRSIYGKDRNRWVALLNCMVTHCPSLVVSEGPRLLHCLPALRGPERSQALRVLRTVVADLADVTSQLEALGLPQLTLSRDPVLQTESLRLLAGIAPRLSAPQLAEYLSSSVDAALDYGDEQARRVVAGLCVSLWDRFRVDTSAAAVAARDCATGALLRLLTDSDMAARQTAASHWVGAPGLEETTAGRLELVVCHLFWPGLEAAYLSYSTYLVLGLAARSPDFNRPMFDHALGVCAFKDVAIVNSWRVQSRVSVPLFSQSAAAASGAVLPPMLLATQQGARAFTPTQPAAAGDPGADWVSQRASLAAVSDTLAAPDSLVVLVQPPPTPSRLTYRDAGTPDDGGDDLARAPRRRRFEADRDRLSARFARNTADQQALQQQQQTEREARRHAVVEVMRRYRKGELPDTEIPFSDLIRPLQALAARDGPTAQWLLVSLLEGTLAELAAQQPQRRRQLRAAIGGGLATTLRRLRAPHPCLVAAVLEAARCADVDLPADLVVSVSSSSGQLAPGLLLLERQLQLTLDQQRMPPPPAADDPPPAKRARLAPSLQLWGALAELCRLYGDWDGARAALARCGGQSECGASALEAESTGDLVGAQQLYRQALSSAADDGARTTCETAYYQCLGELSRWNSIADHVDASLNPATRGQPDLGLLSSADHSRSAHLLEWLIRSKTQLALEGDTDAERGLRSLINAELNAEQRGRLQERFPEELAVLYVAGSDLVRARHFCEVAQTGFLQRWCDSSATSGVSRKLLLQRLRRIAELQEYLSAAATGGATVTSLLRRWKTSGPAAGDSISFWEGLVTRRLLYASRLLSGNQTTEKLLKLEHRWRLQLVEMALERHNHTAAVVHLGRLEKQARLEPNEAAELRLLHTRAYLLQAQTRAEIIKAWRSLEKRVPLSCDSSLLLMRTRLEVELAEKLAELRPLSSEQDTSWAPAQQPLQAALQRLSATMEATAASPASAGACLEMALFCSRHMQRQEGSALADSLRAPFVRSTLTAMADGSVAAADWLPWLLQLADEHTDAAEQLARLWEWVPAWLFLAWLPQLFSYAGSATVGAALRALLLSLARQYPQAVVYPYLLARVGAAQQTDTAVADCLQRLEQQLEPEQLPQQLVQQLVAMQWRQQLANQLLQLAVELESARRPQAVALWSEAEETVRQRLLAPSAPDHERQLASRLEQLCRSGGVGTSPAPPIVRTASRLAQELRTARSLAQYSAWLASFQSVQLTAGLELPGQYDGRRKPLPDTHVRIANFGQQVLVMPSKERPLRLTARGDDAREYHYLVKTGDDLRTDQRIQQLLGILNGSLAADSAAATRRLAVRTYKVLPLQPRLGLIEWLDNTETLRGFIGSAGPEFEKLCGKARKLHVRQMQARSGLGSDIPQVLHGPYAERAERAEVVEDFQKRAAILPPDLLRRAVYRLSAGPESFVRLRSQLSESHALLSTAGWLLAVGDRNLGNLLVSLHDGAMVGIDFGIAFGAAAFLPVPELVPFRMTPQLVGLTAPLGTSGAVRQTMCVALEALRRCHQLLAATLEVFVREPTLDTQLSRRAGGRTEYARECVAAACGRLVGDHPCANLSQLLQAAPLSPGLRDTLVVSARGRPGLDPRAGLADHGLSVQQQVTALLDLATDPYILGLTWSYWDAYV